MKNEVRLYNVMDVRTGKIHSIAIVNEKNVRWFIPAPSVADSNNE